MPDIVTTCFLALMGICVAIGIAETILSVTWCRFYFSIGIPLYKRTIRVKTREMKLPSADDIEEHAISNNPRHPPILVRQIDSSAFGFRETMIYFQPYMSVMHGYIFFNKISNEIELKGNSSWYLLVFTCFFVSFTLLGVFETKDFIYLALPIGLLAIIGHGHLIQKKRYDELAEILHKLYG